MGESKRLLNIHEHKFAELATFQANINVFQVGKLALAMRFQSKDAFPSDTKKNPKDYMLVTLRSGRELESRKEDELKKIEKIEKEETGKNDKFSSSEVDEEIEKK